jgi:hypothetical protein
MVWTYHVIRGAVKGVFVGHLGNSQRTRHLGTITRCSAPGQDNPTVIDRDQPVGEAEPCERSLYDVSDASNAGILGLALAELNVAVDVVDLCHLHALLRTVARDGDRDKLGLEPRSGPFRAVLVLPVPVRGTVSHSHLVDCILREKGRD